MAVAGKTFVCKVSTTAGGAGSYTAVDEISSCKMSWKGTSLDISDFGGGAWKSYIQGLKDGTFSLQGTYDSGDTNGQIAVRSAFINDTELWFQFLPDGSTGWKQQAVVTAWEQDEVVDGVAKLSITLQGTGAPAAV